MMPLVERAVVESSGIYDFEALRAECEGGKTLVSRLHADFMSGLIEICPSGCIGGRGVRARQRIPAGTLVMASKALVTAIAPKELSKRTRSILCIECDSVVSVTLMVAQITNQLETRKCWSISSLART